jgi:8-oxo-dGTP diphosphatase
MKTEDKKKQISEEEFLQNYNPAEFERPSVTVDNVIFSIFETKTGNYRKNPEQNLYLLLIKRGEHPFMDKWALPGGFVRINESVEESAHRELKEETNLENIYMEQLYTFGNVKRDPRMRIISTAYMALIKPDNIELKADTDAREVSWFKLTYKLSDGKKLLISLENENTTINTALILNNKKCGEDRIEIEETGELAFDHAKIIGYALLRLRNKIEYTNLVFNLMPEYFTLTELQKVYEIILGKELIKANFRRKIKDLVTETEKFSDEAGHRPSKLFKFNSEVSDI